MLTSLPRQNYAGFSLIELMISVAILVVVVSMALPSFQAWVLNTQVRTAAESIQSGLLRARAEAVARNTNVEFVLGLGSAWVIQLVDGTPIETRAANEGSRDVTMVTTPATTTTITFNSLGGVVATNNDTSLPFTQVAIDSSMLSAAESRDLRITVGVGGNPKLCNPNLSPGVIGAC